MRISGACGAGELDEAELERELGSRGLMNRVFGRATRAVRKPWHMYPLGCLFGLGFDTATEVGLLVLAGGAAASGLPFYAILCLPILFAAGMSLFDTIDGAFMNFAYGWAFSQPVRKLFYNVAVTGLSVAVALVVGSIELLGRARRDRRHRPQPRRLSGGRPVRADVGARARGLALRPHRAALERRHPAAVTRAPERPPLDFSLGRGHPRHAARGGPPRVGAGGARARRAVRRRRAGVGRATSPARDPSLERTSVYRNLERLEALGVVSHVHVGHGPGLYALGARRRPGVPRAATAAGA